MTLQEEAMKLAILEAKKALEEGEIPVGAVIFHNGEMIASAHNHREKNLDISSHAEIEAMKIAAQKLGRWSLGECQLYVTLEPCLMCAGAILQARLNSVCYGADDPERGAICSKYHAFDDHLGVQVPLVQKGVLAKECANLLNVFFEKKRK